MTALTLAQASRPVAHQWLRSYLLLLRWQLLRQRKLIGMFVFIQVALGVGVIYGFAFLLPKITPGVAVFFSTGSVSLTLILLGLVVVPQEVAQSRLSGRQDYLLSLPLPRLAPMLADVTFWSLMQLPGAVITMILAVVRFHLHLHLSILLIPAALLTTLTASSVGCAISMSLPPMATQQISQFLSIGLMLFSPINFPLSRLPLVLQDLHRGLPVVYLADLMRGSLTGQYQTSPVLGFTVAGSWCAFGLLISARAAARRP